MGIGVCALAVRCSDQKAVLDLLGLEQTGATVTTNDLPLRSRWAAAVTPEGWTFIVGDFWRADDWPLRDVSALGLMVMSSLEEHVMVSDARAFQDGEELWFVARDPEKDPGDDPSHLEARGNLPPEFPRIRDRFLSAQEEEDENVDHLIEIPLEIAKSVCGLRPDFMLEEDAPELVFQVLTRNPKSIRAANAANAAAKRAAEPAPAPRAPRAKPTTPFWSRFVSGLRRGWATYRRARAETRAEHAGRDDDW